MLSETRNQASAVSPCPSALRAMLFAAGLMLIPAGFAAGQQASGGLGAGTGESAFDAQYLLNLAEQGDSRAAFLLGARFASGRGSARDDSEAFRWFEKAAEAGLAEAQYNLAVMYASGRGVSRNMEAAARWYEAAAEQGIAEAEYNIGTLYGMGLGVPQDEVRAAQWLEKAAAKSLPQAQFNLGVLYEHGRGVRLDAEHAMAWYRRAAEQGYDPAMERLAALEEKFRVLDEVTPPVPALSTTEPPPAPVAAAERPAAPEDRPSGWVAGLDPDAYTIQLLSDTDEENVKRFVDRHVNSGRGGYFTSSIDGQIWHSAVYGEFESRAAAEAASEQLPPELRKLKPWIRKVSQVHARMLR